MYACIMLGCARAVARAFPVAMLSHAGCTRNAAAGTDIADDMTQLSRFRLSTCQNGKGQLPQSII